MIIDRSIYNLHVNSVLHIGVYDYFCYTQNQHVNGSDRRYKNRSHMWALLKTLLVDGRYDTLGHLTVHRVRA
jgi:hypothetical protein